MCDFCENIKEYNGFDDHDLKDGIVRYNEQKTEYFLLFSVDSIEWVSENLKINFCPMCGRKLSEETEKPSIDEIAEILKEELTADEYLKLKENAKMFSDAVDGLWKILNKGFHDD